LKGILEQIYTDRPVLSINKKSSGHRLEGSRISPSEGNWLIPRLALLFEEPCPIVSG